MSVNKWSSVSALPWTCSSFSPLFDEEDEEAERLRGIRGGDRDLGSLVKGGERGRDFFGEAGD
jgi:hypothetical protein